MEAEYARHVYHIYCIRAEGRDALIAAMAEREVYCGIHYPVPLHLQDAYGDLGYEKGRFPVTEKCAEGLVSLPMFAELTEEQMEKTVKILEEILKER